MSAMMRLILFVGLLALFVVGIFFLLDDTQVLPTLITLGIFSLLAMPLVVSGDDDETMVGDSSVASTDGDDVETALSQMVEAGDPKPVYSAAQIAERLAHRMNASLAKHLETKCTVLAIEDTGAAYEIDLIIGDTDMLKSYQETAIIPYSRVRDMKYWQQITKILLNNYRVVRGNVARMSSEPLPFIDGEGDNAMPAHKATVTPEDVEREATESA